MGVKRVDIKTGFVCNNNCRFCVQGHNKHLGNRSFDDINQDLLDHSSSHDSLVLTGGEVTIRDDFLDIVKSAKKLGFSNIQIQTNGRMFSSLDFCKVAIKAGATEFSPALHGFCSKQHDYLTRTPGSFNQTVAGIKNLKKLGAYVLTNTVVVKPNYEDCAKIAVLLVNLGVDQFQFAFVHPIGETQKNLYDLVPKVSLAAPHIHEALRIGVNSGISVMAEAMPHCMMVGFESFISEKYIPSTKIIGAGDVVEDYRSLRVTEGKSKFPQCKSCISRTDCEGPWKEYADIHGFEEFIALK